MRNRFGSFSLFVTLFPLWAACGGGGGDKAADSTRVEEAALDGVPVIGQFLADCRDGIGWIDGFAAADPLSVGSGSLPQAREVLASGDPDTIPVIGGLVPEASGGSGLEPIGIDETLARIPPEGLSGTLPVVARAPVSCGDLPRPPQSLPDPTDAAGLIVLLDENGLPAGVILATVSGALSDPSDVGLPQGSGTLPEPFASTVAQVLSLLGSLSPTPAPSPSPTPTPTPGSGGQVCGGPFEIPCPPGQICTALGTGWGECIGL
jgi:hypothetical protein